MRPQQALARAALLAATTLLAANPGGADQRVKAAIPRDAVATLGDRTITESELDELAKDRLARIRSEEYQIKRQVLEEYITRALIEKEAKERGVTVEQLQASEIDARVMPVTEEQTRAVYESSPPQQYQGKSEAEAFALIEANLTRVRTSEARNRFMKSLRAKTAVKILLEPPRLAIAANGEPATGPVDAAVTLVEFSDFQCPACGRAFPTIKRLMQQYQGKIRVVFRDFPLPIHPLAPKAAEAAACAHEQGKFWELHDRMFTNQQKLAVADLKAAATDLGLDGPKFNACLDSGKNAAQWQADVNDGRKYGVSATPTFFINGRIISGAMPYQNFADLVEEELARSGAAAVPGGR